MHIDVATIRVGHQLKNKGNISTHYFQVPEYNNLLRKMSYVNIIG